MLIIHTTSDFSLLADMDCIIICVPTPLNKNRKPDMTQVFNTTKTIAQYLRRGQLIVLESTTYPGTTDEDMRAILEQGGLKTGEDFYLAYSPERKYPKNKDFPMSYIPKAVDGYLKRFNRTCCIIKPCRTYAKDKELHHFGILKRLIRR